MGRSGPGHTTGKSQVVAQEPKYKVAGPPTYNAGAATGAGFRRQVMAPQAHAPGLQASLLPSAGKVLRRGFCDVLRWSI